MNIYNLFCKGSFNKRALYTKDKNNLDIKLKPHEPELICFKLKFRFKTKFTCSKSK